MNETTALADYIMPDTHNFESWNFTAAPGRRSQYIKLLPPALAGCRPRHSPNGGRAACLNGSILQQCGSKTAPSARLRRRAIITDPAGQYFSTNEPGGRFLLSARPAANIAFMGRRRSRRQIRKIFQTPASGRILPAIQHTLKADGSVAWRLSTRAWRPVLRRG